MFTTQQWQENTSNFISVSMLYACTALALSVEMTLNQEIIANTLSIPMKSPGRDLLFNH